MADKSSPAILPVSNTDTQPANADGGQQQQTTTSSSSSDNSPAKTFFSSISNIVHAGLANRRPWKELLDLSAFSKPQSIAEATLRLRNNYAYFRINYLIVIAVVQAVSLLTNPKSLILVAGLIAAWLFLYLFRQPSDPPVVLCGHQFSEFEILLLLIFSSAVVLFLTSVGSVLVSALMAGVAIVCLHGAFRNPEQVFINEQEQEQEQEQQQQQQQQGGVSGFLTFIASGTPAPSTSQPPVATKA